MALLLGSTLAEINRETIFAIAFLLGSARAFEMPTTQALLPNIVPAGLSTSLWFSLATLVLLGAADMVIRGAFVQLQTPDAMRGRVSAVPAVLIGGVGALLVSAAGSSCSPPWRPATICTIRSREM